VVRAWMLLSLLGMVPLAGADPASPAPPPAEARVVDVYDGDTLTLDTGDKIRLRWVNTPERRPPEPLAEQARRFTERFVGGSRVTLVVGPEPRDAYGRILAGIRTPSGDLSLALLEAGLGHVFIIPPDDHDPSALLAAQARAREARRGMWGHEAYQADLHVTSFHANAPGDDAVHVNGEYARLANMTTGPLSLAGWSFRNRAGQQFPLPAMVLPPGHTVRVHSGIGTDQTDPTQPLDLYLGSERPIWNDDRDTLELIAPDGRVVSRREHGGGG